MNCEKCSANNVKIVHVVNMQPTYEVSGGMAMPGCCHPYSSHHVGMMFANWMKCNDCNHEFLGNSLKEPCEHCGFCKGSRKAYLEYISKQKDKND